MSCDDVMQSDGRELGFRLTSGTVGLEYWSLLMTRDDRRWGNNERIQLHSPVTTVHFREIKMMPPDLAVQETEMHISALYFLENGLTYQLLLLLSLNWCGW
jgi:hypothetical protein